MYVVDETTVSFKETVAGQEREFFLLGPQDRIEMIAALKKERRATLIANLGEAGIAGEQRFAELEAFEERWDGDAAFIGLVNGQAGDVEILVRALRMGDRAAAVRVVGEVRFPRKKLLSLKAALTGLELVTRQEGDPDPNPQAPPATYGTPDGTEKPAASPTGSPA